MKKLLLLMMILVFVSFAYSVELLDFYSGDSTNGWWGYTGQSLLAINFTVNSTFDIEALTIKCDDTSGSGNLNASIWTQVSGEPGTKLSTSDQFDVPTFCDGNDKNITWSTPYELSAGTYELVVEVEAFGGTFDVEIRLNDGAPTTNFIDKSGDGGATWTNYGGAKNSRYRFFLWGTESVTIQYEDPTPADESEFIENILINISSTSAIDAWWNNTRVGDDQSSPFNYSTNSSLLTGQGSYQSDASDDDGTTNITRTFHYVESYVDCGSVQYASEVGFSGGLPCSGADVVFDDINDNSPTFNWTTFRDVTCKIWDEPSNYTVLDDAGVPDCGTTGAKEHICTLNKFLSLSTEEHTLYASCQGDLEINDFTGTPAVINLKLNVSAAGVTVDAEGFASQYLQIVNFTPLTIGFELTVSLYNPSTTNFTNITVTPDSNYGTVTKTSLNASQILNLTFQRELNRGTSDAWENVSYALIEDNISMVTNNISMILPIDPPHAFLKDCTVDCDLDMQVSSGESFACSDNIILRNAGNFIISGALTIPGWDSKDNACDIIINEGGSLQVLP